MNTALLLFAQYEKALLTFSDVQDLTGLARQTLRNRISNGTFPRPIPGDTFALQDVAEWIDSQRKAA